MRKLIAVATLLALPALAEAQTAISVNINQARLEWTWVPGAAPNDGVPDVFVMKCGQQSKVYTKTVDVPFKADPSNKYSLPVRQAINGNGNWFCTVTAKNQFGESAGTNEVPFVAGAPASSPSNLSVVAQ